MPASALGVAVALQRVRCPPRATLAVERRHGVRHPLLCAGQPLVGGDLARAVKIGHALLQAIEQADGSQTAALAVVQRHLALIGRRDEGEVALRKRRAAARGWPAGRDHPAEVHRVVAGLALSGLEGLGLQGGAAGGRIDRPIRRQNSGRRQATGDRHVAQAATVASVADHQHVAGALLHRLQLGVQRTQADEAAVLAHQGLHALLAFAQAGAMARVVDEHPVVHRHALRQPTKRPLQAGGGQRVVLEHRGRCGVVAQAVGNAQGVVGVKAHAKQRLLHVVADGQHQHMVARLGRAAGQQGQRQQQLRPAGKRQAGTQPGQGRGHGRARCWMRRRKRSASPLA